jgi:AraC-like DNA-binding protein
MTEQSLAIAQIAPITIFHGGLFVSTGRRLETGLLHDTFELLFVNKGSLEIRQESRTFSLEQNQTFLLWPKEVHAIRIPEGQEVSFYWLLFNCHEERVPPGSERVTVPRVATVAEPERLLELLHRCLDDLRTDRLTTMMGYHLIGLILGEISRSTASRVVADGRIEDLVDRILVFIARHYDQQIGTSSIAHRLGYNADYLERVFRAARGISITEAIHRKRIKEARRRLIHDYANIDEIARACGFHDSGYFRRVFRRHTDMTPTRFRSLYSQVHVRNE